MQRYFVNFPRLLSLPPAATFVLNSPTYIFRNYLIQFLLVSQLFPPVGPTVPVMSDQCHAHDQTCRTERGSEERLAEEHELAKEEREAIELIIDAFRYYRAHSMKYIRHSLKNYYFALPKRQQDLIPQFPGHLRNLKDCVLHNYEVIKKMLEGVGYMFENVSDLELEDNEADQASKGNAPDAYTDGGNLLSDKGIRSASEFNMEKLHSTLKQFARDWGDDELGERRACYEPMLKEVMERFPNIDERSNVKVLVPGAGLGRLAFEFARHGFASQGNEFSFFMLIASNFILNQCKEPYQFTLYPWIHQTTNNMSNEDQIRPLRFPDVSPSSLPPNSHFSMAAGDFLEVYGKQAAEWDVVASAFFIDTAHNIIDYIELIDKILRPGGVWINFGPLLYHFAGMLNERSLELSYEDVRDVIRKVGFDIVKEQTGVKSTYTQNSRSMLQYSYDCVFFVAVKPV